MTIRLSQLKIAQLRSKNKRTLIQLKKNKIQFVNDFSIFLIRYPSINKKLWFEINFRSRFMFKVSFFFYKRNLAIFRCLGLKLHYPNFFQYVHFQTMFSHNEVNNSWKEHLSSFMRATFTAAEWKFRNFRYRKILLKNGKM